MAREKKGERRRVHIWLDVEVHNELMMLFGEHPGFSAAVQTILARTIKEIKARREAHGAPVTVTAEEVQL